MDDLFEKVKKGKSKLACFEAYIDGASSGNPGPSGIGVLINKDKKTVSNLSQFIGMATNNVAEYTALIFALEQLIRLGAKQIIINTDSQLLANQIKKKYKVKNSNLKILHSKALRLLELFENVEIKNVLREKNREADRLAVNAIREQAKMATRQHNLAGGKSGLQREA